ncbi:MAG TPA: hypothetical protein VHJ19_14140 [Gammaproteobacteria bacterium]|nr:hypothetical protein [Gammaproteobacteria bacterium]
MSQQSKLKQSRQQWQQKATERAEQNRYLRKELARLRQERDGAKRALKEAKKHLHQKEVQPANLKVQRVWLALTLFAGARISFRAVSRVLHVLALRRGIGKAPCPQTVINWVTRLSMVRMQSVRLLQGAARPLLPFTNGLIWMIDTSITLGTGKLLSVLALDAYHDPLAGCAPGFQHVHGVAVAVSPSWTGECLADLLERVISVVGRPAAYLKDGGSELKRAVDVLSERGRGSPVIDDISHAVANMLKRRYETHPQFSTFLSACGRVSSRLKHTVLACLAPPKVQTKARFMHVHRLVRWADWVLGLLPAGRAKTGSVVAKLRTCLDELPACRTLLRQFRDDAVALLACQKMLKTRGLTHDTLTQCDPLLDTMASVRVRQAFARYLHHQLETAKELGLEEVGLPISSDPIESLFGLSKQHGVGPLKDANRMVLRIPALCGVPTLEEAQKVLAITVAQQQALSDGVFSLTKQRRQMRAEPHHLEQLGSGGDQGNVELIPPGKDCSDRSTIIYLPNGYKEVEGPFSQRYEVPTNQATVVVQQVQNPVKGRTPI